MISVEERRIDHVIALGYTLMLSRSVMACSAWWAASAGEVDGVVQGVGDLPVEHVASVFSPVL